MAPLPLASNRPWSWSLLAMAVGALCLLWPWASAADRRAPLADLGRLVVPGGLFLAVVAWALLQSSSLLQDSWAASLSREAAAALGGPGADSAPTFLQLAAATGIMRLLCYAGVFWLAFQHGRSERRARWLVEAMAVAGFVYAVYGLAVFASGNESILLMRKWAYPNSLTSTFVNRNTYATYAGLTILCAIVAAARRIERPLRLRALLLHFRRPTILFAVTVPIIIVALLASGSRAGTASLILGVAVLVGTLRASTHPPGPDRRKVLLAGTAAVSGLFALLIGILLWPDALDSDFSDRLRLWGLTLELIEQRPWTGYGLGGFASAFAMIRPPDVVLLWTEAHNTYLELAVDLGMPAAAMLVASVLWLVGMCMAGVMIRRRDAGYPALGVAATALVGFHALFDFSLQIPGLTVVWAAILGVAVAQSYGTSVDRGDGGADRAPPEQ